MAKRKFTNSDVDEYRIAHYLIDSGSRPDGLTEYVVILQPGEDPESEEFKGDGFSVGDVLTINGDAGSMPCSRSLVSG